MTGSLVYLAHPAIALARTSVFLRVETSESRTVASEGLEQWLESGDRAFQQQQFRQAVNAYQQAKTRFRAANDRTGEGIATTRLGLSYYRLGQYQNALEALQQGLVIHQEVRDRAAQSRREADVKFLSSRDQMREAIEGLGLVYMQLAQYPKALDYFQQVLSLSGRSQPYYGWDGQVFNHIGNVYFRLGQYPKALEYYQQAFVVVEEAGFPLGRDGKARMKPPGEVNDAIYGWQRRIPRTLQLLDQALKPTFYEPARIYPWARSLLLMTFNNVGRVYTTIGPVAKGTQFHLKALEMSRFVADPTLQGQTFNFVGESYRLQGDPQEALKYYKPALEISQRTGDRALAGLTLTNMGTAWQQADNLEAAATALKNAVAAWEAVRPGLADANMVSLFETQLKTYQQLQQVLVAQNQPELALEVAEQGRARAFAELLARRSTATDQPASAPPTLAQMQQIARRQAATLVQYSVIPDRTLYIWVIQPTGTISFRQVDLQSTLRGKSLAEFVSTIRGQTLGVQARGIGVTARTGTRDDRPQLPGFQSLYQVLIAPIADQLPTDPTQRVILLPQGPLFLVPFAALQQPSGKYLIEQHTLLTAPSIQALGLLDRAPQKSSGTPLVVGNPLMPVVRVTAGAPPEPLSRLPGAEREAQAIAQLLQTAALTGSAATETAVLQRMPQASLIHLATHGLLDDFQGLGMPGAIALAPTTGADGLLTAEEILNLRLQAELVVLSACNTGRGTITGDGVLGLSRALLSAGVPRVLVSLWAVPDAPTATLMTEFYQNQQKRLDPATALRQAMLTAMQQYPNPSDWAAFTLVGSAQAGVIVPD
jgi:CHAT domain-containing protein